MCTLQKRDDLFFLTLTSGDDHFLGLLIIDSLLSAFAEANSQATRGSILITTTQGKFLSNERGRFGVVVPRLLHDVVLVENRIGIRFEGRDAKGMKVKGDDTMKMEIVESAHNSAESIVEAAVHLGEYLVKRKWNDSVYTEIRKSLSTELSRVLGVAIATPKAKP